MAVSLICGSYLCIFRGEYIYISLVVTRDTRKVKRDHGVRVAALEIETVACGAMTGRNRKDGVEDLMGKGVQHRGRKGEMG